MPQTESEGPAETDVESGRQEDARREDAQHEDAMKDQLRKDVASWSASRSAEAPDHVVRSAAAATRPAAPATRTRAKAKPAVVAPPVETEKKPFKMSYDGTTDRDYIAQRIKLGAR